MGLFLKIILYVYMKQIYNSWNKFHVIPCTKEFTMFFLSNREKPSDGERKGRESLQCIKYETKKQSNGVIENCIRLEREKTLKGCINEERFA